MLDSIKPKKTRIVDFEQKKCYRTFHEFGQAKFAYDGLILGCSQFTLLPQLSLKNNTWFKSGQNKFKNNYLNSLN